VLKPEALASKLSYSQGPPRLLPAHLRPLRTAKQLTASLLISVLLASCSATRNSTPAHAEELTRLVLFIRELPDGSVGHTWHRAEDIDLSRYSSFSNMGGASRRIVPAMGRQRDCDAELVECMRECMSRPLARGFGHITSQGRGRGGKEVYCQKQCMQPYLDCKELQELKPQEFTAIDSAVDWLKSNREWVLAGSVIIIAGVVFVVVSAGAGLLILAPAVLLTTPEGGNESCCVAVLP
jgi:hypothetical protein